MWLLHWRTKFHIDISSRLWVIGVSNVENWTHTQTHGHTRTCTHTHTSERQLKITFLDVLDYSEYSDTNILKKKNFTKTYLPQWASKRKTIDLKLRKMYWLVGTKSQLSLYNKLIIDKVIIKPVRTYGIQLWELGSSLQLKPGHNWKISVYDTETDAWRPLVRDKCGNPERS